MQFLVGLAVLVNVSGCSLLFSGNDADQDAGAIDAATDVDAASVFDADLADSAADSADAALPAVSMIDEIDSLPTTRLADPEISADGLELFYTLIDGSDVARMYVSTRPTVNDSWSAGVIVVGLNNGESDPRLAQGDLTMYLTTDNFTQRNIFVSTRPEKGLPWSAPSDIMFISVGPDFSLSMGPSGTFGVVTYPSFDDGSADLGTLEIGGAAPDLTPLDNAATVGDLNTAGFDGNGDLSPDGTTLYFESDRNGSRDIFVATRSSVNVPFTAPVPVAEANSGLNDGDPTISFDGQTLIFVSNRTGKPRLYTLALP